MAARRQNFTIFQNEAFDLALEKGISDGAWRLYCVLLTYRNRKTGKTFPSHETLAARLDKDRRTVVRLMKELTDAGLVVSKSCYEGGERTSNRYTFPLEREAAPKPKATRRTEPKPEPKPEPQRKTPTDLTTYYDQHDAGRNFDYNDENPPF